MSRDQTLIPSDSLGNLHRLVVRISRLSLTARAVLCSNEPNLADFEDAVELIAQAVESIGESIDQIPVERPRSRTIASKEQLEYVYG